MRTHAARVVTLAGEASEALAEVRSLDELIVRVWRQARTLPALTPINAAVERARLIERVSRGEAPQPRWELGRRKIEHATWRMVDEARARARDLAAPRGLREAYLARLDELEVDLAMIAAVGDPVRIRPLAARRFGTGMREVDVDGSPVRVAQVARALLERIDPAEEPRTIAPESVAARLRESAHAVGLSAIEVKIDPRLVAGAATGDHGVFLAARRFGGIEARRLVVHEIGGHAVAAANAAVQPIRLWEVGTAGSFADQEGLAICLEEEAGVLDAHRMRVLAARVVATDRLHSGASFGETARYLHKEHGFSPEVAVAIAERAHRGGGIARDAGYLYGYLRVRAALRRGEVGIDALRAGRVGLDDVPLLRELEPLGLAVPPRLRPRIERVIGRSASREVVAHDGPVGQLIDHGARSGAGRAP